MDLTELEVCLDEIVGRQCDSAEIIEWLATQAAQRAAFDEQYWKALDLMLGKNATDGLSAAYHSGGREGFLRGFKALAKNERAGLPWKARKRLKMLTKISLKGGSLAEKLGAIHGAGGALDKAMGSEDWFQVAFAYQLIDMIVPASQRAALFTELIVKAATSTEAEKYLEEAYYCFFYGLYTACAITCRSVLEEVIERRLPRRVIKKWKDDHPTQEPTLGSLIGLAKGTHILPTQAYKPADSVLRIGNKAAHQQPVTEDEALSCLSAAREALGLLL